MKPGKWKDKNRISESSTKSRACHCGNVDSKTLRSLTKQYCPTGCCAPSTASATAIAVGVMPRPGTRNFHGSRRACCVVVGLAVVLAGAAVDKAGTAAAVILPQHGNPAKPQVTASAASSEALHPLHSVEVPAGQVNKLRPT